MIIDDSLVSVGSTNFDFRSFENNFECNLLIHDKDLNKRMKKTFEDDMSVCVEIDMESWKKRPLKQRMLESVLRLVSPIL